MKNNKKNFLKFIPAVTTAVAALMLSAGIISGEPAEVWKKAVSICLSCIGIG